MASWLSLKNVIPQKDVRKEILSYLNSFDKEVVKNAHQKSRKVILDIKLIKNLIQFFGSDHSFKGQRLCVRRQAIFLQRLILDLSFPPPFKCQVVLQKRVQAQDAARQVGLFIIDRDDNVKGVF